MGQQPLGWDRRSQEETGGVRIGHKELKEDRSHQDVTAVSGMGHEAPGGDTGWDTGTCMECGTERHEVLGCAMRASGWDMRNLGWDRRQHRRS